MSARPITRTIRGKPLTFFAAMGFILVGLLPVIYGMTPDNASFIVALPAIAVAIAIPVDIICVLLWARAKIKKDPHAFDDE